VCGCRSDGAAEEAKVRVPALCSGRGGGCSGRPRSAGLTPTAAAATMTTMQPSGRASQPSPGAYVSMFSDCTPQYICNAVHASKLAGFGIS
jgi:hypothetical protein